MRPIPTKSVPICTARTGSANMQLTAHFNEYEIKETLRSYSAPDCAVHINMHKASENDPCEYDYVDATVEYTK